MDTQTQSLRLGIDGSWAATDMADSFTEFNFLYNLRLFLNSVEDAEPYWEELYHFFPPFRNWTKRRGYPHPLLFHQGPWIHRPDDLSQFSRLYYPQYVLQVSRIEYGSPGVKDFLGIGEILKQVRLFVQYLIELPQRREAQELSNNAQRIQNARDFVKLRVEYARGDAEIEQIKNNGLAELVDDNTRKLVKLIEEKKITSATMLEKDSAEGAE